LQPSLKSYYYITQLKISGKQLQQNHKIQKGTAMATLSFNIGHVYCYDCIKGVKKFIGGMKGVQSVSVENNNSAVIEYDPSALEVDEKQFKQIARNSIERLGFRIKD
jgi:copper chaperone CopZ